MEIKWKECPYYHRYGKDYITILCADDDREMLNTFRTKADRVAWEYDFCHGCPDGCEVKCILDEGAAAHTSANG